MAKPENPQETTESTAPDPEKVNPYDPCNTEGSGDETASCKTLGKIESGGSYTAKNPYSSASGRYQFTAKTGKWVMGKAGIASTTSEASALWDECATSSSAKCKGVQDKMCAWYSSYNKNTLLKKGVKPTVANVYFAWNQGIGGMATINDAGSGEVTDPSTRHKMAEQAWNKQNTTYNGEEFIQRMNEWVRSDRGVDPTALI